MGEVKRDGGDRGGESAGNEFRSAHHAFCSTSRLHSIRPSCYDLRQSAATMALELHIWGPGFGLPSIDASCLATIALFRDCLKPDEWSLIPSSDPTISPLGELPVLKDGEMWVAGYRNIVTYLSDASAGKWNLGSSLNEKQSAECTAYLSFIESRGLPLVDLLLYVSSENYNAATRPALGNTLSWPQSWVLPGKLRDRAKKRSEHLGLSSLDVDTIDEDKDKAQGLTAHIPVSLRKPKQTVSSILGRDMRKNKFRLDAVCSDFLEPMDDMLGQKECLFGNSPGIADRLAVAVIALVYTPKDLPQSWLRTAIDSRYPRLARWVEKQSQVWFGNQTELPWQRPAERSWQDLADSVAITATEAVPCLGSAFAAKALKTRLTDDRKTRQHQKQLMMTGSNDLHLLYSQAVVSALSVTTLLGVLLWKGLLRMPQRSPTPRLRHFGEAGSFLGLG
jgi:sorting and assembly machinery component 37